MKQFGLESTWLRFAFHNALRNRRRSLVTVSVAALGSAALLLAGGFAYSTYEGLAQSAARSSGHLIVGTAEHFDKEEDTPLQYGLSNVAQLDKQILSDPAVRYVLPRVEFSGLISNGDKSTIMLGVGIDADAEFAVKGPFLKVVAGSILQDPNSTDIVIGEALARSLKATPGSNLTLMVSTTEGALNAMDVNVRGIVTTGIPDIDKRLIYTGIHTAQSLLHTDKVSSLGVFLNSMQATPEAQQRLRQQLNGLTIQNWEDQAFFYKSVRELYNRIFGALGFIISLIVVFVVANAMAMAIIERTRETGSLRAMGTLPGELIRSFSYEGMFLGGSGALLGAAIAVAVALLLTVFPVQMPPPPGRSTGYPLLISLDLNMYVLTISGMIVLSMLSSALIARRTLNQPVVDALAHT
ncbi:ABC transporter permease [Undibacterium crateris]|uniref:ABC transporter permease n=1 Tax=Undibacterium crateris TaxID=2528175 RepID=UPI001389D231|nr:FtsX-like permease family protein [Undibacterium crateris]NDI87266.1 FtsX-like permease family protein [Undibacterium crateris]